MKRLIMNGRGNYFSSMTTSAAPNHSSTAVHLQKLGSAMTRDKRRRRLVSSILFLGPRISHAEKQRWKSEKKRKEKFLHHLRWKSTSFDIPYVAVSAYLRSV